MRDLVESVYEYYLLREGLSKEPSSPIEMIDSSRSHTKLTTYGSDSKFETPDKYHPDYYYSNK